MNLFLDITLLVGSLGFIAMIVGAYFANIVKLIKMMRADPEISFIFFSRVIGIFFPIWGIVMGFV